MEFEVPSVVPATPERVWARVSTMAGVNYELRPLVSMTGPRPWAGLRLDPDIGWPTGVMMAETLIFR